MQGNNRAILGMLRERLRDDPEALAGITNLEAMLRTVYLLGVPCASTWGCHARPAHNPALSRSRPTARPDRVCGEQEGIPVVVIVGPDETADSRVTLRDLRSRRQETVRKDARAKAARVTEVIATPAMTPDRVDRVETIDPFETSICRAARLLTQCAGLTSGSGHASSNRPAALTVS